MGAVAGDAFYVCIRLCLRRIVGGRCWLSSCFPGGRGLRCASCWRFAVRPFPCGPSEWRGGCGGGPWAAPGRVLLGPAVAFAVGSCSGGFGSLSRRSAVAAQRRRRSAVAVPPSPFCGWCCHRCPVEVAPPPSWLARGGHVQTPPAQFWGGVIRVSILYILLFRISVDPMITCPPTTRTPLRYGEEETGYPALKCIQSYGLMLLRAAMFQLGLFICQGKAVSAVRLFHA